jgi:hypothetical protein
MIDAFIKRVSVTYKCYEMYAHRGEKIDQEMDAILLIIGIVYGVCRIDLLFPCKQIIWPRFLRMQLTLLVTGKNE